MLLIRKLCILLKDHYAVAGSDLRTKDLPICNSHNAIILIMSAYVFFSLKLGPYLMAKRKPYNMKTIMQCYNIVQIVLNFYIFLGGISSFVLHPQYNWFCFNLAKDDFSPKTLELRRYTYLAFLSKILDLLDTVFFILRKKNDQISFLHVYHHTVMLYAAFLYHNIVYGTQFTSVGWINSLIHVLMYTYYFLAALETKINLERWKPRMTQIQILQFFYISIKVFVPMVNNTCGLPYFWLATMFVQNIYMTLLFLDFYWKAYIVKDKRKRKATTR